jgi:predicted PurR-regulated permease PerM
MEKRKVITFDRFVRLLIGTVFFIALYFLSNKLSGVLLPFFIAWLLAYFMHPLVLFFQKKLKFKSRILSILAALLSVAFAFSLIFYLLIPPMIEESKRFAELATTYVNENHNKDSIPTFIGEFIKEHIDKKLLDQAFAEGGISNIIKESLPRIWTFITGSVNIIFNLFSLFIILLYLIFILKDYETLTAGWIHLVPGKYKNIALQLSEDVKNSMNNYFRGQLLIATLVGVLFAIGFTIINLPVAIGLGLFIGLLNIVPYLQIIGIVPTTILVLLKSAETGQNFWVILLSAFIVFCVVQSIQDLILTPKIMGKAMRLNPAVILLSLSIWGTLLGFIGLIIALPLTSLLLSYYKRYVVKEGSLLKIDV